MRVRARCGGDILTHVKPFDSLVSASTSCLQFSHHGSAERWWPDIVSPSRPNYLNQKSGSPGLSAALSPGDGHHPRALRQMSLHLCALLLFGLAKDASSGRG